MTYLVRLQHNAGHKAIVKCLAVSPVHATRMALYIEGYDCRIISTDAVN